MEALQVSADTRLASLPHTQTSGFHCMIFHTHGCKSFYLLVRVDIFDIFIQENLPVKTVNAFFGARTNKCVSTEFPAIKEQTTNIFPLLCFRPSMGEK